MGEDSVTYNEALAYALCGEAVFIVGSGFSTGAENQLIDASERNLWVGSQLAKKLAELTEMDSDVQLDIVSQEYIDMFGEKALIDYLKKHYTVEKYAEYYKSIAKIKNIRVYLSLIHI